MKKSRSIENGTTKKSAFTNGRTRLAVVSGITLTVLIPALLIFSVGCRLSGKDLSMDKDILWTTLTARILASDDNPLQDMVVIAVSTATGRSFSGLVDQNGDVAVRVPQNCTYVIALIGPDGKALASVVVEGASARPALSDEAFMGIKSPASAAGLDLGTIVIPDDAAAEPIKAMIDEAAIDVTVKATVDTVTGVPVGVGTHGRSENPSTPAPANLADPDGDGIPNIIDADDDNDGIPDDLDPDSERYAASASPSAVLPVELVVGYLLDIRGVAGGLLSYFDGVPADIFTGLVRDMRTDLMIFINDPARIDAVQSVALLASSSPAYAAGLTAAEFDPDDPAQVFADGSSYIAHDPVSGNPLLSADWELLENDDGITHQIPVNERDSSADRLAFRVALKLPDGSPVLYEAGDTFTVEIRYTAESGLAAEYCSEMINFIYDNVTCFQARAVAEGSAALPAPGEFISMKDGTWGSPYPGDQGRPITIEYQSADQEVWFKIVPPQYDDGTYITEGGFRYELFDGTAPARSWHTTTDGQHRYDSDLADEEYVAGSDPPYFAIPIPIQYIIDTDVNEDSVVEIEYFMNVNDHSYIKNRLFFELVEDAEE